MDEQLAEALIGFEDHPDVDNYEVVKGPKIIDRSRWSIYYEVIYRNKINNTYWSINYGTGATEQQDGQDEEVFFSQVEPVEVTKIEYKVVKNA